MCLPQNFSFLLVVSLILLLSHFSRVRLCVTPETAAHQAPLSLGFSRQEHWSGLPFPSPMHESEKWKWSRSVLSDSCDPMDCSLPGFSVHRIFQARVLEWVPLPSLAEELDNSKEWWMYNSSLDWWYLVLAEVYKAVDQTLMSPQM